MILLSVMQQIPGKDSDLLITKVLDTISLVNHTEFIAPIPFDASNLLNLLINLENVNVLDGAYKQSFCYYSSN